MRKSLVSVSNVSRGDTFLLRSTENLGGRGNPFSPIDVKAFHTTNFRSRSAMHGAEFHGNTRREGATRIRSIGQFYGNIQEHYCMELYKDCLGDFV